MDLAGGLKRTDWKFVLPKGWLSLPYAFSKRPRSASKPTLFFLDLIAVIEYIDNESGKPFTNTKLL